MLNGKMVNIYYLCEVNKHVDNMKEYSEQEKSFNCSSMCNSLRSCSRRHWCQERHW